MDPTPSSPNANIEFPCPTCKKQLKVPAEMAGRAGNCPSCNEWITIPRPGEESIREGLPAYQSYQGGDKDPYALTDRERQEYEMLKAQHEQQNSGQSQMMGWVIFILIFGVGNLILYATTGIFLIPIPRR